MGYARKKIRKVFPPATLCPKYHNRFRSSSSSTLERPRAARLRSFDSEIVAHGSDFSKSIFGHLFASPRRAAGLTFDDSTIIELKTPRGARGGTRLARELRWPVRRLCHEMRT